MIEYRTKYERQLIKQLLDSKLNDGRSVKELLDTNEPGTPFIRRVLAMLSTQQEGIAEAGQLIALAAQMYAESKGENGNQALAHNISSQLEIMEMNFLKSKQKAKNLRF